MIKEDAQHKHRPAPAPRTETATITTDAEQAALSGPGDSLAAALRDAEIEFALASARLQAVKQRLQAKGMVLQR